MLLVVQPPVQFFAIYVVGVGVGLGQQGVYGPGQECVHGDQADQIIRRRRPQSLGRYRRSQIHDERLFRRVLAVLLAEPPPVLLGVVVPFVRLPIVFSSPIRDPSLGIRLETLLQVW